MLRECCKQFCWQGNLDECTDPWGIRVERVEMWVRLGRIKFSPPPLHTACCDGCCNVT